MAGSAEDTVEEDDLGRFDSSFISLHGKALGHFQHFGWKSLEILAGIQYFCVDKFFCLISIDGGRS